MQNNVIKLTEQDIRDIIKESINNVLIERDTHSPYDDTKVGNGQTQPVKDNVNLQWVRQRVGNIYQSLKKNDIERAKKQTMRLYKLVDAMFDQGF